MNKSKKMLSIALSVLLAFGPGLAYADTISDLNAKVKQADEKLAEYQMQAAGVGEQLNEV